MAAPNRSARYARREGFLLLNGLNYGENWLGGDWVGEPRHFLYSYDRFFDYCLRILDRFSGKGEAFYQFWNEPDNFWRPGFGVTTRMGESISPWFSSTSGAWSRRETRTRWQCGRRCEQHASDGRICRYTAPPSLNDTVQMHYPGAYQCCLG